MKIVLAGGTGFIGTTLRRKLISAGHEVIVLTRQAATEGTEREVFVAWDAKTSGDWASRLDGVDAVINLAGENIAGERWTPVRKQKIISSRVDATRAIVNAIAQAKQKPAVLINASAVGYYGDADDRELTEKDPEGTGFLAATCNQWETEAHKVEPLGVRLVVFRLGPVLGEQGGMLSKMIPPFLFFVGAPLGTGKQWISWVHIEDVIGAIFFALSSSEISGSLNIASGTPVTMKEFCHVLARALRRPCWPSLPSFFIRMMLGEMAAIILSSQRVIPRKLLEAGYLFRHTDLSRAFEAILKKSA